MKLKNIFLMTSAAIFLSIVGCISKSVGPSDRIPAQQDQSTKGTGDIDSSDQTLLNGIYRILFEDQDKTTQMTILIKKNGEISYYDNSQKKLVCEGKLQEVSKFRAELKCNKNTSFLSNVLEFELSKCKQQSPNQNFMLCSIKSSILNEVNVRVNKVSSLTFSDLLSTEAVGKTFTIFLGSADINQVQKVMSFEINPDFKISVTEGNINNNQSTFGTTTVKSGSNIYNYFNPGTIKMNSAGHLVIQVVDDQKNNNTLEIDLHELKSELLATSSSKFFGDGIFKNTKYPMVKAKINNQDIQVYLVSSSQEFPPRP